MNRFEQKNRSLWQKLIYLLPILAFIVLFVLFLLGPGTKHFPVLRRRRQLSSIPGISETALRAVI